jgi:hypothetical protein
VTLTEAQIERYSRQIVLPEVGARGQIRLLAGRVGLAGEGTAATLAAMLLARAGVGTLVVDEACGPLPELSPDCRIYRVAQGENEPCTDISVAFLDHPGRAAPDSGVYGVLVSHPPGDPIILGYTLGEDVIVGTLLWRSCLGCFRDVWPRPKSRADASPALARDLALASLVANEALRVLLTEPTLSRLTILDSAQGAALVREVEPVGCAMCGSLT